MVETRAAPARRSRTRAPVNFIRQAIDADLAAGKVRGRSVVTRFPPEPNGYLHIGHAKSICLNFGIARDYPGAVCRLRFDDTNPTKERVDFMEEIQADVRWLGFDWGGRPRHASDYFEPLFEYAVQIDRVGRRVRVQPRPRGDPRLARHPHRAGTRQPLAVPRRSRRTSTSSCACATASSRKGPMCCGRRSTWRSPEHEPARPGHLPDRAHTPHPLTGRTWCVFPMYDFAQALSDTIEGVTHSLCTLEFEDHRPLYEWFLETLRIRGCRRARSSSAA